MVAAADSEELVLVVKSSGEALLRAVRTGGSLEGWCLRRRLQRRR